MFICLKQDREQAFGQIKAYGKDSYHCSHGELSPNIWFGGGFEDFLDLPKKVFFLSNAQGVSSFLFEARSFATAQQDMNM